MTTATIQDTRRAFRTTVLEDVRERAEDEATEIESGPLEGLKVVSLGTLDEVLSSIDIEPLPKVDGRSAEVATPAEVFVDAICPRCGLPGRILAKITAELLVTSDGSELRLKAKAKARTHICGQLALDMAAPGNGQGTFELDDIVGPEDAAEDGGGDAEDGEAD